MAFPKQLRLQLGLSLTEFADLLNTNVGQLSMAESGLRSLPVASREIANTIEEVLKTGIKEVPGDGKLSNKATTVLTKEIRSGQVKLELLKIQELKITEKLAAARCMVAIAEGYLALPPQAYSEEVNLQMALLQRKAKKKIEKWESEQIQLQLSIANAQATISKAQELLLN